MTGEDRVGAAPPHLVLRQRLLRALTTSVVIQRGRLEALLREAEARGRHFTGGPLP